MDCITCQTSNPEGAKFCISCGAALSAACPSCGTGLPPEAKFCSSCGHQLGEQGPDSARARLQQYIPEQLLAKLETARSGGAMQGERRVVTMLFCDVSGSTAAAEALDPEEWAEIMNGAFEHLIAPVYRYEGTLARLMGDAILAFFGAPIGHEDDPQRAVLAGLDILKGIAPYREDVTSKWGLDFNVRVGINTGLVVVGEVGSDLRVEYTALGDAINLASRMEQTAQLGTLQISADTHKLVAPLFEFEELGGIQVKGKSEPVEAYRVLGPRAKPGPSRGIEGLDSPLVGRDQQVGTLRSAVSELRQGRGQIVSLMGEAGLGKSRLIAELRKELKDEGAIRANGVASGETGPGLSWHEGRSLSYESSKPYAPFVDLFNRYLELNPEDKQEVGYAKVRARTEELLPGRVAETAPFIAALLDVDVTGEELERIRHLRPPQLREGVFRATQEVFEALARTRPCVLVLEDLHWSDSTSLDLLEQLMPLTDRTPFMILSLFRPQRQEPSWRFHELAARDYQHRYTSIVLEPLDEDDSRVLVANLLAIEDLPEAVRGLILSKAEGNPFFVEEVIRSLLDAQLVVREDSHWRATREIENIAVPDTLAGVITARLDRLDEQSRRVLQTASVIDREFQFGTLQDVHDTGESLEQALTELQRRELIREKSTVPHRVYAFKHVLTQETAYASLLLSRRRELHGRVAECWEQMEPERVGDIARHLLEADEPARALPYLVNAGDRAARAYSTPEAMEMFEKALGILGEVKDAGLARRAYEGLGGALTFANDVPRAVENYHSMFHEAQKYEAMPMQVSALNKLGFVTALMQGEFPEAEEHLGQAHRLANQCQDLPGLAELHMTYCYMRVPFGDFDGAIEHPNEAAQIGKDLELEEPRLFGLTHIANTLNFMTRFDEAWQAAQEARQLALKVGNHLYLSELLAATIPMVHVRNGDLDAASESAKEGMDLAAQIGSADNEFYGALTQGQVLWLRGDYQRAIACYQRALEASWRAGMPYMEAASFRRPGYGVYGHQRRASEPDLRVSYPGHDGFRQAHGHCPGPDDMGGDRLLYAGNRRCGGRE